MSIFRGAGVAIITPMKNNDTKDVNYDKLEELIDWQIKEGTDCIVVVGSTGEGSTLTMEEHKTLIKRAVEFAHGRIPVIAGTGSNCTDTAIQLTHEAEEAGVDGVLVVSPYYNKSTQEGLVRHFSMIAESTKLPIVLYNINGYYDRMKALLQHTADEKFMDVANMELCAFMDGPEQILTYIENYRRQWTQTKE